MTDDGLSLHYKETRAGTPVVFVQEHASDHRAWEPQMRHFGHRYRAITHASRDYSLSDVPAEVTKYSQRRAADDIRSVPDLLGVSQAHILGLSMDAACACATSPSPRRVHRPSSRSARAPNASQTTISAIC